MATRKVNVAFEIEGVDKYKEAVKDINSHLKILNAQMKLVTEQYKDNADSEEAVKAKTEILNAILAEQNQKVEEAQIVVNNANKAWEKARDNLNKVADAHGRESEETEKARAKLEAITREREDYIAKLYENQTAVAKTENAIRELTTAEDDAQNSTEKLSDKMQDAEPQTTALGDAIGTVSGKLGVDLPDGVTKALNKLGSLDTKVVVVAGAVAGLAVAAVKAKKALDNMTLESGQKAEELLKLSSVSGVATDTLQKFQYAGDFVGVSSDALADSLKDLTKNMSDAANGNEEYADKFSALGVSITNTDGSLRNSYDVFLDVIDALGEMSNKTERDAAAMGLINESAQQLNPLIEAGTDALRAYGDEAERMGAVLSEDDLKALKDVDDAQNRLKATQEAVTDQIALQYSPHMKKALEKSTELVNDLGGALVSSGVVDSFGLLLEIAMELFDPIVTLTKEALPPLKVMLDAIAGVLAWIADMADTVEGMLTFNLSKIGIAMGYGDMSKGEMSNLQKWKYGSRNADAYAVTATGDGRYVGNGAASRYDQNYYSDEWVGINAGGTDNWRGGWTRVGESGPETVYLPQGAQIATAQESRGEHATVVIENMTVDASSLRSMQDIIDFFDNLERYSRMGVT